jgi:small ligand-binding sensory domain FIST
MHAAGSRLGMTSPAPDPIGWFMLASGTAARAALAIGADWRTGLAAILPELAAARPNLLVLFAAHHLAADFAAIAHLARDAAGAEIVIGCSTTGVIGNDRELERLPAISCLALALPGATLSPVHVTAEAVHALFESPAEFRDKIGVGLDEGRGWFVFGDPVRLDGAALAAKLRDAYPGAPVVGGLTAAGPRDRQTWCFLNDRVISGGAVALAFDGAYDIVPLVSQGCAPIGQSWTITSVDSGWIETIANRPATELLGLTLDGLEPERRRRAERNVLIGVAVDERRQDFQRGEFVVRPIDGYDHARGAIAVAGGARVGQSVHFVMRDPAAADLDLAQAIVHARTWMDGRRPIGGLLFAGEHRGAGLFGSSHHDAAAITRGFGSTAIAGCFCAAEIGPIGLSPYAHVHTATLGMICGRNGA